MSGNPNTIVVLGPSPESYYVGHGRRHFVQNMSPSFTNHAKTGLNISMTLFTSMSKDGQTWVNHNIATDKFHFNADINQDIKDHLSGLNGKFASDFVSFPDSDNPGHYFVKGKDDGAWNAVLPNYFIEELSKMQREVENFDLGLTGILFGMGKTHICLFKGGFTADLDDEYITSTDHPLYKVLLQYNDSGYCIERGSTLCLYDSRYFFLKFKKPGESTYNLSWNLPPAIAQKLAELKETAQKPEEQMALMQEDQMWMQVAQARINSQMQNSKVLSDMMVRAGLSIYAAASGGTVVETTRW
ncbi:hypothetical protein B0H15DRAFT_962595 [Mycena belliarum]|uniref:Uncharacterized protein n=1 Tax=Mycena belliarum TaxID=1033014 RepID=A0AAD6UCM9_9AGAR|nr:hypothetical protein B0H15DRAFT_962595 [Mycena belliae]